MKSWKRHILSEESRHHTRLLHERRRFNHTIQGGGGTDIVPGNPDDERRARALQLGYMHRLEAQQRQQVDRHNQQSDRHITELATQRLQHKGIEKTRSLRIAANLKKDEEDTIIHHKDIEQARRLQIAANLKKDEEDTAIHHRRLAECERDAHTRVEEANAEIKKLRHTISERLIFNRNPTPST